MSQEKLQVAEELVLTVRCHYSIGHGYTFPASVLGAVVQFYYDNLELIAIDLGCSSGSVHASILYAHDGTIV